MAYLKLCCKSIDMILSSYDVKDLYITRLISINFCNRNNTKTIYIRNIGNCETSLQS